MLLEVKSNEDYKVNIQTCMAQSHVCVVIVGYLIKEIPRIYHTVFLGETDPPTEQYFKTMITYQLLCMLTQPYSFELTGLLASLFQTIYNLIHQLLLGIEGTLLLVSAYHTTGKRKYCHTYKTYTDHIQSLYILKKYELI